MDKTWNSVFACLLNCLDSVVTLDTSTKHAFVADYSGVITVLKLDPNNFQEVTTLRGHQSKRLRIVRCSSCIVMVL